MGISLLVRNLSKRGCNRELRDKFANLASSSRKRFEDVQARPLMVARAHASTHTQHINSQKQYLTIERLPTIANRSSLDFNHNVSRFSRPDRM